MASKKKLKKGIKSLEKLLLVHEKKLKNAFSEEGAQYLLKDIERLKKQKNKKEKKL